MKESYKLFIAFDMQLISIPIWCFSLIFLKYSSKMSISSSPDSMMSKQSTFDANSTV